MEIKATLAKPYQEKERLDFIVAQNHVLGYQIKETEEALEAWGYTETEQQEQAKAEQRAEIIAQLDAIDLKEIRPLAAKASGTATSEDEAKLIEYEEQKATLREQLEELNK